MKKTVLTYGLISGAIVSGLMGITVALSASNPDFSHSYLLGYTTMLLAFSMIFLGVKKLRDKDNGGIVSFGRAFRVGCYIALIASTMYVIVWAIEYNFIYPDFMEKYSVRMVNDLKAAGAPQVKIDAKLKEMASMREWYKNPFFFTLITYAEILPLGVMVSLVCALILKRGHKRESSVSL